MSFDIDDCQMNVEDPLDNIKTYSTHYQKSLVSMIWSWGHCLECSYFVLISYSCFKGAFLIHFLDLLPLSAGQVSRKAHLTVQNFQCFLMLPNSFILHNTYYPKIPEYLIIYYFSFSGKKLSSPKTDLSTFASSSPNMK